MAIRIVSTEAQRKITGKTEIKSGGKIQQDRLKIQKGAAQPLGVAGQTVQPEKIQRKEKNDGQHHDHREQNGEHQLGAVGDALHRKGQKR